MEKSVINEFVSGETKMVSRKVMQMVEDGRIRNHKMVNISAIHHGDIEDRELNNYRRFLLTRNFYDIVHLYGKAN